MRSRIVSLARAWPPAALALVVIAGCSTYGRTNVNYYDFGRTFAAMEHGEMSAPEVTDGVRGHEIWAGYGRVRYQADSGSTVESAYPSFGFRQRLARWCDAGMGFAWTQNNHYLATDLKLVPWNGWFTAGLDVSGQYYLSKDKGDGASIGLAIPLGTALAPGRLSFYVTPRASRSQNLVYMVESVSYSGLSTDKNQDRTYAHTNALGASAGLVWTVPLGGSRLKVRPEASYSAGREERYNDVVYELLTFGLRLHLVF